MKRIVSLMLVIVLTCALFVGTASAKKDDPLDDPFDNTAWDDAVNNGDWAKVEAMINGQEKELVFEKFDNDDAFSLGLFIISKAKEKGYGAVVDITRNGQQLFHVAAPGSTAENDHWIRRKNALTNRSYGSSLKGWCTDNASWMEEFNEVGMTYINMWGLNYEDATQLGGAFPLQVKGVGCIGTITISAGLPHTTDHKFLVDCIKEWMDK